MPKVTKTMNVTASDGRTYKKLPFLGYKFESIEEALGHPAINGRYEPQIIKDSEGNEKEDGLSIVSLINYALDLRERPKVKAVWLEKILGPDKSMINTAKDLVKAASARGQNLTLVDAVSKVKVLLGIDDSVATTSLDFSKPESLEPVDSEPLLVAEPDTDGEGEEPETKV